MRQISGFMLRSVRDMLRWNVLRIALFVGIPFMVLWIWIGFEIWDYLVAVASMIISWIPFSIVKANGALFIIFFIWFILVLVSFAAITALVGPPLLRHFKEKTYYVYTFTSLMLLSAAWAVVLMAKWDFINAQIQQLLTELPFQTVADASAWLLAFYLLYNAFILTLFILISIFRKIYLEPIRQKEYPHVTLPDERLKKRHHGRLVWDAILFVLFSLVAFPILFIPMANVLVQWVLWAWLYRESYFLSTCNLYCTSDDYEELKKHGVVASAISLMTAMLNFLPVINIFAPFFAQLMFFHWIMEHKGNHAPVTAPEYAGYDEDDEADDNHDKEEEK
ncbi:EI24 domain-containing protein [Hydrogenimonas sp.]